MFEETDELNVHPWKLFGASSLLIAAFAIVTWRYFPKEKSKQ